MAFAFLPFFPSGDITKIVGLFAAFDADVRVFDVRALNLESVDIRHIDLGQMTGVACQIEYDRAFLFVSRAQARDDRRQGGCFTVPLDNLDRIEIHTGGKLVRPGW